ncbi:MAG: Coenzyme F420 hydrogenase/dehydrogenase, beta subunit C-terminal domain [Bacteroidetes bacterium]|nr:Coenzyme F420 hydrogenase/dehydrogenase, beta subunit C-terminal domain [Bacteroidota bacterium]
MRFTDRIGTILPQIEQKLSDTLARDLWTACSGEEVNFPALNQFVFGGKGIHHPYFGTYRNLLIAFSSDPTIRRRGGSAGVISTALIWLLERNMIQGAVVLGMSAKEPWLPRPFIATTREEVLSAAQSKYLVTPVNELLPEMEQFNGTLTYVGLPCQVHSIRKLQMAGHPSVKKIGCIIAPYCGLNLHFSSIRSFLRSHGEKDYREIADLQFRHGEWPGNMRVEMKSGRVYQLPKFHANYLIPFHMMDRCRVCIDVANEFADISVGDAWAPVYEERGKGFSIVMARSKAGKAILDQMIDEGVVEVLPLTEQEAVKMHSHMYDNKKRGAFIRMKRRKFRPDYNLSFPSNINFKRRVFEFTMSVILVILRTRLVTWVVDMLPSGFVGKTFNSFKVFWKRITFSVKREDL